MYNIQTLTDTSKINSDFKYIVLVESSYITDHGYRDSPLDQVSYLKVLGFDTDDALKDWIMDNPTHKYRILLNKPVDVEAKIVLTLKESE